jgi:hypothetical protein
MRYECGCKVHYEDQDETSLETWMTLFLEYCPTHKAAPDLLAALRSFVNHYDRYESAAMYHEIAENARQIIARAGGGK